MPAPKGNQYWKLRESWGKKKWDTPEELQGDIDRYYEECENGDIPLTIQGLCCVLECSRETILNYQKEPGYEVFFDTIKKAKMKIERNKVERVLAGKGNPAFTIFDMKNNHGHKDKTEVDNTHALKEEETFIQAAKDKFELYSKKKLNK